VMITVIATGFDSTRRRDTGRAGSAVGQAPAGASVRGSRDRDFIEEIERQRALVEGEPVGIPVRPERTVGAQPAPVRHAYDADDLEIPSFLRRK